MKFDCRLIGSELLQTAASEIKEMTEVIWDGKYKNDKKQGRFGLLPSYR
jgi:hypothetical protein